VRRREFISLALAAVDSGYAFAEEPGQGRRIAVVSPSTPVALMREASSPFQTLFHELKRLGHVEGRNLVIELYSGLDRADQLGEIAQKVVDSEPDIILAVSTPVAQSFQAATATIPIVALTADPVAYGVVASLSHPGKNITGASADAGIDLWSKKLELLREAVPSLTNAGFLGLREEWEGPPGTTIRQAAERLGVRLTGVPMENTQEPDYRRAFAAMSREHVDGLVVSNVANNFTNRALIAHLAEEMRIPAIYSYRESVKAGGLMAYSYDLSDMLRGIAGQIDQILKGANPGDIPFFQPSKFKLSANVKAAEAIGITIPSSLLLRADEVIE
jgi:ABC-type uncharacterized transport system substrate-binding protein